MASPLVRGMGTGLYNAFRLGGARLGISPRHEPNSTISGSSGHPVRNECHPIPQVWTGPGISKVSQVEGDELMVHYPAKLTSIATISRLAGAVALAAGAVALGASCVCCCGSLCCWPCCSCA